MKKKNVVVSAFFSKLNRMLDSRVNLRSLYDKHKNDCNQSVPHFAVVDIHDELIFPSNASGSKIICKVTATSNLTGNPS